MQIAPAISRTPNVLFWFLSVAVALVSLRWLPLGVELSMPHMLYHSVLRPVAFTAHVTFGPLALLLAPFQFLTRLRSRHPAVHRWIGRTYGASVLIAGAGGLLMALGTEAGPIAAWGFGALAVLWMAVTARGVWLAMSGRIAEHRRWMIRSVALTFAGVTLRLQLPILAATMGFESGYTLVAWSCWLPNVLVAEWLLRRRPGAAPAPA